MKKLGIPLLLLLLLAIQAYALSISGELKVIQDFAPGAVRENTYVVRNAEGYPVAYDFLAERQKGADLTPYFEIEPKRVENVPDGGSASFKVRFTLP
ncbi:MAG: hypothetical protein HGA85_03230, partial [Nanoarchaeota archaeon]|nr:hypothetical protein [Nanoarchaeota archaeon]